MPLQVLYSHSYGSLPQFKKCDSIFIRMTFLIMAERWRNQIENCLDDAQRMRRWGRRWRRETEAGVGGTRIHSDHVTVCILFYVLWYVICQSMLMTTGPCVPSAKSDTLIAVSWYKFIFKSVTSYLWCLAGQMFSVCSVRKAVAQEIKEKDQDWQSKYVYVVW